MPARLSLVGAVLLFAVSAAAQVTTDLVSGQVDVLYGGPSTSPHIAAGKLRAIAYGGAKRSPCASRTSRYITQVMTSSRQRRFVTPRHTIESVGRAAVALSSAVERRQKPLSPTLADSLAMVEAAVAVSP